MNPKKQLSKGDKCLQRVIDGKFKGDLWGIMEVIFDESDKFYLEETIIEANETIKLVNQNTYHKLTGGKWIDNIEEVMKSVKKSYHDLLLLQKEYDLDTPERLLIDKQFLKILEVDNEALRIISYPRYQKNKDDPSFSFI